MLLDILKIYTTDKLLILCISLCANLPFTNDCQKSACQFTDANLQYAFLHKMSFYTTGFYANIQESLYVYVNVCKKYISAKHTWYLR